MTATVETGDKIKCEIDGALVHSIELHLKKNHPGWDLDRYVKTYGDKVPLLSKVAEDALRRHREEQARKREAEASVTKKPMHEVFGLPREKCLNALKNPILVRVVDSAELDEDSKAFVPDVDPKYVFNIDLLKTVIMAFEVGLTGYAWGVHGTGKSTLWEQACARTGRPYTRIQHERDTELTHIVGQWTVKDGNMSFILGPLPEAMLKGHIFCADEYDRAQPGVSSVYQAVLEGKPLVIKDAPPELRVIRPHKNFRFVATGNTNGSGDETGLYQGTVIQDSANYSRFAVTIEVQYPEPKVEQAIVAGQSGVRLEEAAKLVEFATEVRTAFRGGQISQTISPRELITAGKIGLIRGGDWAGGLALAFANRLSRTDKEVVAQYSQRLFGTK